MITVIDYGAGNLGSVVKALRFVGCTAAVEKDPGKLSAADAAVLPGVGAFGEAMESLKNSGFVNPILDFIASGKPFLGICLGLQLLFESSEEAPGVPGLGVLKGKILRIPAAPGLKIPHVGWNTLSVRDRNGLFRDIIGQPYVYFVHSYYLRAEDRSIVSATAEYGVTIDAAVRRNNLEAVQFHPEKSGRTGLKMLRNFADSVQRDGRERNNVCQTNHPVP